jgi:multimeric flavodoxin WrbA
MAIKVLGISASPRVSGNSEYLLEQALNGARDAGATVEKVQLYQIDINPCIECDYCHKNGLCKIQDDYQPLLEKILESDRLIFASPVFFMTISAGAKILIDRGQSLWAKRYILGKDILDQKADRRAMVIAVGGSKSKRQFECISLIMSSYFDILEMKYCYNLCLNKVDKAGDVTKHPTASQQAYILGDKLVTEEIVAVKKTNTILL